MSELNAAVTALADMPVPTSAAVRGSAAGAGADLSLLLACDVVLASRVTKLVFAYPDVGLTPGGGASWFLPRQVGLRGAISLSMMSMPVLADEALRLGLINQVCDDDQLECAAAALADRFEQSSTVALVTTRRLMTQALSTGLRSQLDREAETLVCQAGTVDAREGIDGATSRRPPRFGMDS